MAMDMDSYRMGLKQCQEPRAEPAMRQVQNASGRSPGDWLRCWWQSWRGWVWLHHVALLGASSQLCPAHSPFWMDLPAWRKESCWHSVNPILDCCFAGDERWFSSSLPLQVLLASKGEAKGYCRLPKLTLQALLLTLPCFIPLKCSASHNPTIPRNHPLGSQLPSSN